MLNDKDRVKVPKVFIHFILRWICKRHLVYYFLGFGAKLSSGEIEMHSMSCFSIARSDAKVRAVAG